MKVHARFQVIAKLFWMGSLGFFPVFPVLAGHEIISDGQIDIPMAVPGRTQADTPKRLKYRVLNLDNVPYQFGSITLRCLFKDVLAKQFSDENRRVLLKRLNSIVIEPAEETTMLGRTLGLSKSTVKPVGKLHGSDGIAYENSERKYEDPDVRFDKDSGQLYIKYRPEGETSCEKRPQIARDIPAALRAVLQADLRANRLNPQAVTRDLQDSMNHLGSSLFPGQAGPADPDSDEGSSTPAR